MDDVLEAIVSHQINVIQKHWSYTANCFVLNTINTTHIYTDSLIKPSEFVLLISLLLQDVCHGYQMLTF